MAEERDRQSIGTSRSLVPSSGYQLSWGGSANGSGWFGPLAPMNPVAPPSVKGRILDYPSGYNMAQRPRAYEPITFEQLRNFADAYDLLRIIIETRKDQMARQDWTISVRDRYKDNSDQFDGKIDEIKDFMLRPDQENFWPEWLRMILEDLFVIDAPAIHRRRTMGGDLFALDPLDGATIKRVIDDYARTPEPPLPAYQQVLKGLPAVEYTSDELIYRPRNKRTNKIYGFSPVEQIVMTINIALRRQIWQLQSFTEGNMPEALIGVPATWTPDQLERFQDKFDMMLQGNSAERRKARFVPGEIAKNVFSTKPDKLFEKEAEEWLARVVCFAFSVSPQPFVQIINRATAETAADQAVADGLMPIMNWVKSLMDTLIIDDFGAPELEFSWLQEDEVDPDTLSKIIDRDTANGTMTINDARRRRGEEPYDDPDADRPMFRSLTGYTPIFLTPEEKAEKDAKATAIAGGGAPGGKPDDGTGAPPNPAEEASNADLSASDEVAGVGKTEGAGKSGGPFLDASSVSTGALTKSAPRKTYISPDRPAAVKAEEKTRKKLIHALSATGASVAGQIKHRLEMLGKADVTGEDTPVDIDLILESLSIEFDAELEAEMADAMAGVYSSAGRLALGQLGSRLAEGERSDLVDQVNERSLIWARENAASLITDLEDVTRGMLRATIANGIESNLSSEAIASEIEEGYGFSEDRAALISMTEVASANSMGALDGYKDAASLGIAVRKSWLILEDACDDCQANEDDGVIDLEDSFSSGDDAPPAHPNCRCVLVPEAEDDNGETIELDEIEGD